MICLIDDNSPFGIFLTTDFLLLTFLTEWDNIGTQSQPQKGKQGRKPDRILSIGLALAFKPGQLSIQQMASTFSVPQQQSLHHHNPLQPPPLEATATATSSLSLKLLSASNQHPFDQNASGPSPASALVTAVVPHLRRHGHHHHPTNSSGIGNLSSSLGEYLKSNPSNVGVHLSNGTASNQYNYTSVVWNGSVKAQKLFADMMQPSGSSPFTNLSSPDVENSQDSQDIYDNSSLLNNTSILEESINSTKGSEPTFIASLYAIIVPVMIFFCALTCIVNLVIVISARWCRKPMSPTLYYSISLALADAYASFILGVGLIINSLLPKVYGVKINQCLPLTVEAFR